MTFTLRLCLDVNIWISYLKAEAAGRAGTSGQTLVSMVSDMRIGSNLVQLVVPKASLSTLQDVATRQGVPTQQIVKLIDAIISVAQWGPEKLDPFVHFGADTLQMSDREDAGVLAGALNAGAHFLITDNLKDFANKDADVYDTQKIDVGGKPRQLSAIIHQRANGSVIVIAHPFDFLKWVRQGVDLVPDMVRSTYTLRSLANRAVGTHVK